jgi:hypothetical protein
VGEVILIAPALTVTPLGKERWAEMALPNWAKRDARRVNPCFAPNELNQAKLGFTEGKLT